VALKPFREGFYLLRRFRYNVVLVYFWKS